MHATFAGGRNEWHVVPGVQTYAPPGQVPPPLMKHALPDKRLPRGLALSHICALISLTNCYHRSGRLELGDNILRTLYLQPLKFWANRPSLEWNLRFSIDTRSYSASAVTASEKSSINTNRKSTTRFPISLRWSSYVAPKQPEEGSKTQNGRFSSKIALRLKKVSYEVSLCENYHGQSWLNYPRKNDWCGRPLLPEILGQTDSVGAKSPIFDLFSPVAPQP